MKYVFVVVTYGHFYWYFVLTILILLLEQKDFKERIFINKQINYVFMSSPAIKTNKFLDVNS